MEKEPMKDPNVQRRMELARRFRGRGKWKSEEAKREYDRLVRESLVISQKEKEKGLDRR